MKNHVNYLRSVEKFRNLFIYLTISKENMVRIDVLVRLNQQNHLQYDIREVTPSGSPLKGPPPPEAGEYLISYHDRVSRNNANYATLENPLIASGKQRIGILKFL